MIDPNQVSTFGRLLTNLGLPPALAQATANFMQVSQKNSGQTPQAAAAAAAQASAATTVAQAGAGALGSTTAGTAPITGALPTAEGGGSTEPLGLTQRDDLLAVQGFTPDIVAKLKEFVIVLPTPTPVNVNTAPAEVISAIIPNLSLPDASGIIARRTFYNTVADFTSHLSGQAATLGNNTADVKTNYFLVNGKVRLSRAALDVQSLIQRNGTNTAIIWTRQN